MSVTQESGRVDVTSELAELRAIAREAAKLVMRIYATDFAVEYKGKDDPVTIADREANTLICERLARAFPSHGILAEESAPTTEEERRQASEKARVFFVDPVDGTREFADKNGEFCVMIGLAVGGHAAAGVVAIPVEDTLLWGSLDGGTFRESLAGGPATRVTLESPDGAALRAVVSRSHPSPRTLGILERAGVKERLPCGSVGLKAARVIAGRADLYVHPSRGAKLWDACAPDALIRGAGGIMTYLDGSDIDYRGGLSIESGLIATQPALLPQVLAAIASEPA